MHKKNGGSCISLRNDLNSPTLQAIERMKQEVGEEKELKVEYLLVDLASFSSVKDFVRTFREMNLPLHILVNNAAVAWIPFSRFNFKHLPYSSKINYARLNVRIGHVYT